MKNIKCFDAPKYQTSKYQKVEDFVYTYENEYGDDMYFISITFEQEPELGEGDSPEFVSQYPLDDILQKFSVCVFDEYYPLNKNSTSTCYLELFDEKLENILNLKNSIIGKHVYNKEDENGNIQLIIE